MQATKWVLGLGMTAGALLTAVEAKAVFVPPTGDVKFKLTDASNVYRQLDGDPELDAVPRGNLQNLAGVPQIGDEDFTAFRLTSFNVNGGQDSSNFGGETLVGVVTFLEIENTTGPLPFGGNTIFNAGIGSTDRAYNAGPAGSVGRFFLFSTTDAAAGDFDFAGADTVNQVDFSTGLADNLITDSNGDQYTIDHLTGFTRDAGGTQYELVLTGGIVPDNDGDIDNELTTSGTEGHPEEAFFGSIATHDILIDGGLWFHTGLIADNIANFQINQVVYSDLPSGHGHDRGDESVFNGGWQISSEDPIQITVIEENVIPEPVTAGLGTLAMGSLAAYATRRRRA
jgi:hypothetical protein